MSLIPSIPRICPLICVVLLACTQAVSAQPQQARAGMYLMNVYDISLEGQSFYADFYLWFKWKGRRNPASIEFVNAVEKWAMTQTDFHDTLQMIRGGYKYNGMRLEGRFYHPFELSRFPLDQHTLMVKVENTDFPADSLIYLPDSAAGYIRNDLYLPGWHIRDVRLLAGESRYNTNFGRPEQAAAPYSNIVLSFTLARPWNYFWLKLMLPLFIVILVSLGALLVSPAYTDARISIAIAGLISSVFLQQSYSSALPDVGYMVLMDKIYLLSYGLIAAVMLRAIVSGNQLKNKGLPVERVRRYDIPLALSLLMMYVSVFMILIR